MNNEFDSGQNQLHRVICLVRFETPESFILVTRPLRIISHIFIIIQYMVIF